MLKEVYKLLDEKKYKEAEKLLKKINKQMLYTTFTINEDGDLITKYEIRDQAQFDKQAKKYAKELLKAKDDLLNKLTIQLGYNKNNDFNTAILLNNLDEEIFKTMNTEQVKSLLEDLAINFRIGKEAIYRDLLKSPNVKLQKKFTQLDEQLIKRVYTESYMDIALRTQQMTNEAKKKVRKMTDNAFKQASLRNESFYSTFQRLKAEYDKGDFFFKDSMGKVWKTEHYAEMIARTKAAQFQRDIYMDNAVRYGMDLIVVVNMENNCSTCGHYDNKILSITGATKGVETVDHAKHATINGKRSHLYGPNCNCVEHVFDVYGLALDFDVKPEYIIDLVRKHKTEKKVLRALAGARR